MLHSSLAGREAELAAEWQARGSMRIQPLLDDEVAGALLTELRGLPHRINGAATPDLAYLYFRYDTIPDPACDHVLCTVGRWLFGNGRAWIGELVGRPLEPPGDGGLAATLFSKGCYLDPHNDADGVRSVTYVLGLTDEAWPAERGGDLEFLAPPSRAPVRVVERRAPGWNSLDLFDVERDTHIHRIPMLLDHRERRAISGWFRRPAP